MTCYILTIHFHQIFFPMISANHYFVVCYNLKDPALEILDNICPDKELNFFADQQINLLVNFHTFNA